MTDIVERHCQEITDLCERTGARRLHAFSFTLEESLEELFGRPVDLVTRAGLSNPYLRERIGAERRVAYAR